MRRVRLKTPEGNLSRKAQLMLQTARESVASFDNAMFGSMYVYAMEQSILHGRKEFLAFLKELREPPVSIEEFLDSEDFMGSTDLKLWPKVREAIIRINHNWWKGFDYANVSLPDKAQAEAILMGATGTGKSEISKVTTAYHLHILGCMKAPQNYYGLPKATSIVFVIQAAKPHVTKKVVYMPLRNYVETMPWFRKHMRPHKLIDSEMYFPEQNIRVVPGGSDADTILGEAIIGGVIDEINFMNVVERSKKAGIGTGRAQTYDQAANIYNAVTKRKKSRFITRGPQIGIICCASSTRYKGDFTDKRKASIEERNDKTSYIYEYAQYDVWPQDRYCGDKFRLLVANEAAQDIRVLEAGEKVINGTVLDVPIEYREDFLKDAPSALRDIIGTSLNSINPFFRQQHKIIECITAGEEAGLQSFLHKDNVVLAYEAIPLPIKGHYCRNPSKPRYVHIDLSSTGDRCGIAMVRYDGLEWVTRLGGQQEPLPIASVELALTIEPDHGNEIDIAEVRAWVKTLHARYGYPIKAVTYDGWNSLESRQAWKRQGMKTGHVSVDRTDVPYKQLRDAIYDGRLLMYHQPVLIEEFFGLEYDEKAHAGKGKIDHPVIGSKDCADAVCGAYHTLLTRSSSWVMAPGGNGEDVSLDGRADMGDRFDIGESDRY